ncbi:MAG: DUF424 family protein [Candidatus Diapherotrites archaeon]|nr:DUF424 family protein [Candidatus Diapherotrites archaeon]
MRFWLKVIRTPEGVLVNVCDEDLLEKEFREGEIILRVPKHFYGEELVERERVEAALREGDIISLVGEESIAVAVELGMASWGAVKRVQGVPFLNVYRL